MKIKDSATMGEEILIEHENGSAIMKSDGAHVKTVGDVEVIGCDSKGRVLFTRRKNNALLINGASYFSEKTNNMRCRFAPTPLDVLYGDHEQNQVEVTKETLAEEYICGIVFGIGGCTNTYNTVRPVNNNAITVPEMIPIRMIRADQDLTGEDRARYFLRHSTFVEGVEYAQYYGKVFDAEPRIDVIFESGEDIPNDIYKYDEPGYLFDYTYYTLTVNNDDIRDYFKITDGNTSLSRINSLGLVAGYPRVNDLGHTEFYNIRCLTTVNLENVSLQDSLSQIYIRYRLFIK